MYLIKNMSVLNWTRVFTVFLLIGLLLPTRSVSAGTPTPPLGPYAKSMTAGISTSQNMVGGEEVVPLVGNWIQDPSFEFSYGPGSGFYWDQFSTTFGTPLCTVAACNNGGGTAGPRSGSVWGWFGGVPFDEYATVSQYVTIPTGCGAILKFYLRIGYAQAGSDTADNFNVYIDSAGPVFSTNATQINSYSTYTLVSIDISSYADGSMHKIAFSSHTNGQVVNFNLDDISLAGNCTTVNVNVGGAGQGSYVMGPSQSKRVSYPGLNSGPVKVQNINGTNIVASERISYSPDGGTTYTSYSELMGLPANQLTTSYTFPWYNNLDLNSQLRFGNAGTANTTVTVTIGGLVQGTYNLAPNASTRISYAGLDAGPVKVSSSGNVPIIASMRVAYTPDAGVTWTSFSEMMGLPSSSLTNSYIFPWYNNVDLNSQLRFGNVGTANTTVTVTVGGIFRGSYQLAPNESKRVSYAGVDSGPVKVISSGNVPIIASMRVAYNDGTAWTDFSEMMGHPINSLSTHYSFPAYNNVSLNTQLRFGNVGTVSTTVTVTVGGVVKGIYNLAPNESKRVSFAGLDGGPVVIKSSGGVPIIASERVAYYNGTMWTSFAEMMGLPKEQLTTSFIFPWYNNVDINTQLRFGIP
jgi:hypothetical protein